MFASRRVFSIWARRPSGGMLDRSSLLPVTGPDFTGTARPGVAHTGPTMATRGRRRITTLLGVALLLLTALPADALTERGRGRAAPQTGAAVATAEPNFPAKYSAYHNYPEMVSEIHRVASAHPGIVKLFNIGRSYRGRIIWAAKISDHVARDENEPEVLFDALHHAREHISAEMALYLLHVLAGNYGASSALGHRVTAIVNSSEIWIVFMVNPDGGQYDLTGHPFRFWRKNRQPAPGSRAIGTDINRNYGYRWGCCGGSSSDPSNLNYRGPRPWSTPEARVMRDFVLSRVIHGRQQITEHISLHAAAEEVLWPYGHTFKNVPRDMTLLDHKAFVALGRGMAARNGYTPLQSSQLYITDGDQIDWMYGTQRIFSFTIEMYPSKAKDASNQRFYLTAKVLAREVRRNRSAFLYFLEQADCPYRSIGMAAAYCGPFFDDLEIDRGWRVNPDATDTAVAGGWARGIPQAGPLQLGTAWTGQGAFVTGLAAGRDVDRGRTTARSPLFHLPAGRSTLSLRYWVGLGANATAADAFAVRLVAADGSILATARAVHGNGTARAPRWTPLTYTIPPALSGRDVSVELMAADAGADSTVEAGVDQVRVTSP
jgi:carboxypeptidase T